MLATQFHTNQLMKFRIFWDVLRVVKYLGRTACSEVDVARHQLDYAVVHSRRLNFILSAVRT
jgi:hypothetical protein